MVLVVGGGGGKVVVMVEWWSGGGGGGGVVVVELFVFCYGILVLICSGCAVLLCSGCAVLEGVIFVMVSGLVCDFMYYRDSVIVSVGVAALSFVQHSCILCSSIIFYFTKFRLEVFVNPLPLLTNLAFSDLFYSDLVALSMAIPGFLLLLLFLSCSPPALSLYEDQVGLMDWHQQYIGKVKQAVFHTQKAGRKRVIVSTEENVIASLDLRRGEIFWRHVLGAYDAIDEIDIALGKWDAMALAPHCARPGVGMRNIVIGTRKLIKMSLPCRQREVFCELGTFLMGRWFGNLSFQAQGHRSLCYLSRLTNLKVDKDNVIFVYGNGCLHAVSSIDGEVLWKELIAEGVEVQELVHPLGSDIIYAVGFDGLSQFVACQINAKNGELLKHESATFPGGFAGKISSVSSNSFLVSDATHSVLVLISVKDGGISFQQTYISDLVPDFSGTAVVLPTKLTGIFALKINEFVTFVKVIDEGKLEVVDQIDNGAAVSDAVAFSEGQEAFAFIQHEENKIQLTVKHGLEWSSDLLKESIEMDCQRGLVHKVFINNYVRTDRTYGFRALIVMEDHSLLLVQQGVIVWSREDGLASVIDVTTSELPIEKQGVSVAKVEQNLFEWLKGHMLKLKGTLMLASPDEVAEIQRIRLQRSEKSKMTRDHNGFRKLLIVLTRAGKLFALHTGDGRVVWSLLLHTLHKTEQCNSPGGLKLYQWQVPHHHALDENPSVLVLGRCGRSLDANGVLSVVDTYTGKELSSVGASHSIVQVIPLPFTDSTEQRLHLLIDADQHAHLIPRTREAVSIVQREFGNIYWYSVEADNGIIRGHVLKDNCDLEVSDGYCFNTRGLWSIVFPSESEKIITTMTRKSNEVVHTQAKAMSEQDVMYKYVSKNLLFVANVAPKARGDIGLVTPEESWLVVYLIDTVSGRILHRMTHHGAQGPVHVVFSENWVVYHYFNLKAHRYEMSVIEIYDQSRADNKDVWKLVLGKHNLTSPISSYSRPEVITKSQTYFFTHTVKSIAVTSTAKGITSKQLLIGTIGDQVLALDKRFLDPRRTVNPTQAEKEEGIIPLTDSLPIMPQSYVTHTLKVEGLRGIVTSPAKLESTTLIFAYGVDLFFTRMAPSKTYDSLTEDFSYALLLLTIVVLLVAIVATWILSERKELQDKWGEALQKEMDVTVSVSHSAGGQEVNNKFGIEPSVVKTFFPLLLLPSFALVSAGISFNQSISPDINYDRQTLQYGAWLMYRSLHNFEQELTVFSYWREVGLHIFRFLPWKLECKPLSPIQLDHDDCSTLI
ncbi:hypothetical protein RHGRI_020798 [Rhododendron griersonianum]|uniref:ER membrane protein complex subunit 1 n=1 Tax=Rhododendron griersonianum TaxID=479676 RepID=A0AAV6JHV9_9ERIC|nr:hypothetical protein RHGRI_020798 [Rhododendron griersonianum]